MKNKIQITFNKQEPIRLRSAITLDNEQAYIITNANSVEYDMSKNEFVWIELKTIKGNTIFIRKDEILMLTIFAEEKNEESSE